MIKVFSIFLCKQFVDAHCWQSIALAVRGTLLLTPDLAEGPAVARALLVCTVQVPLLQTRASLLFPGMTGQQHGGLPGLGLAVHSLSHIAASPAMCFMLDFIPIHENNS